MTTYIELRLELDPEYNEILMAELAEISFESFVEEENELLAYIPENDFSENAIKKIFTQFPDFKVKYSFKTLETVNWNEEWEKNYQPIEVMNLVRVRASYHTQDPNFKYDIVIDPKMSFGTGHHETTTMVMQLQLGLNHNQKSVLDVGSGTGILAILAEKLGATQLTAFDIEEWAYLNATENITLNDCKHINVFQGTINDCPIAQYDIVLANINRNILLAEIPTYTRFLTEDGTLIVSGFYENDAIDIIAKAKESGLYIVEQKILNQWAAIRFQRAIVFSFA